MDFRLPELGEGVYEAELVAWLVKAGASVKRGQNLMEVLTDKASMEVPSPFAGSITELRAEPGQQIKVGEIILTYSSAGGQQAPENGGPRSDKKEPAPPAAISTGDGRRISNGGRPAATTESAVRAAPSVRYMARKLGLDLGEIQGSGPDGRILIDDLSANVTAAQTKGKRPSSEEGADYGAPGTRIKLLGVRRKIAEHLVLSKRTIP